MASDLVLKDFATQREITPDESTRYPVVAGGAISTQERVAHAFTSEEAFEGWLQTTSFWAELEARGQRVSEARTHSQNARDVQTQLASKTKKMEERISEVSKRLNLPAGNQEVLIEAFRPPWADPSLVYEAINYGGRSIWIPPIPDLSWIGWANRIQSVQVLWGSLSLWDQKGWRGRKCYLFGFPFWEFPDLSFFGFSRVAKSALINAFDP
jgi:hypothetical protein